MQFLANWLDDGINVAPEERATVAELRVLLAGENVCTHLEDDVTVDRLVLPLYSIADGLAHSWWSIFGGVDRTWKLMDHRFGYAVPDIRLRFDGQYLEIAAKQNEMTNPRIRFWAGKDEHISRAEAERQLSEIVEKVLGRLSDCDVKDTSAALRWKRVQESRADSDEAKFCEAAGALGVDPYAIADSTAQLIELAAKAFSEDTVNEFLAGANARQAPKALEWLSNLESRPKYQFLVPDLRSVAQDIQSLDKSNAEEHGWSLGYRRAHLARKKMPTLKPGGSLKELARVFGASDQYRLAPPVSGLRAVRSDHQDGVHIYTRDHGKNVGAKEADYFAFARAIGDAICFPEPSRSAVNDLWFAHRQSAGRAFAAEFLAPVDRVEAMAEDGEDHYAIADEFAVSTEVIRRQLQNKERIRAVREVA